MCEEKEGVMRNAMTTRAPGGAKNTFNTNFVKLKISISVLPACSGGGGHNIVSNDHLA